MAAYESFNITWVNSQTGSYRAEHLPEWSQGRYWVYHDFHIITPFFISFFHGQDSSTSIFSRGGVTLQWIATTSCKSIWDAVPYFGINGLSMILCLCSPLHPLSKLLAIQDVPCSKFGGTTLNGREEGGQHYISQTCNQQRFQARKVVFWWECLNIFATGCSGTHPCV